jgi:flagellar motility protein MotE (MotC chaperone)
LTIGGSREGFPRERYILLVSFILIKVLVLFVLWTSFDFPGSFSASNQAHAEEEAQHHEVEQNDPSTGAGSFDGEHPDDLLAAIRKEREALRDREGTLKRREEQVRQKEARLREVQSEIEAKLETLSQIQVSLEELIQEKEGLENEILKKLARVYESTPPEQAGPMLARLDVKLAAQILIRMDGRKAGRIWGFVSPERASQISSEISRLK